MATIIRLISATRSPIDKEYFSELILNYDNWNDFHYHTSFEASFCDKDGIVHEIGAVKIYFRVYDERRNRNYSTHTKNSLKDTIRHLNNEYCSLGQGLSYYRNIKKYFPLEYMDIFQRLNDIAVYPEIKSKFINEKGVQISLLRFSSAEKALNEARDILNNTLEEKDISFEYRVTVPYDCWSVDLHFDFLRSNYIPYRINILIGKNGTGKTQILSKIANSLSGYTNDREENNFITKRPAIDKVMSISYSAFDSFRKPPEGEDNKRSVFSYVYCGIQSENGTLSISQLKTNFNSAYEMVINRKRDLIWKNVLSELMESEHQNAIEQIIDGKFKELNWSSGQHILICTITELIANIENESIILFDEPEIHLHPNAIANVMRMFYNLLEQFNSYAIFSTHSPIILQEIPSKYIQILDRADDTLTVRRPDIECFGNNISDIIYDVFDVSNLESNYKSRSKELSKSMSYNEILKLFDGNLSFNALVYLKNCCSEEEEQ